MINKVNIEKLFGYVECRAWVELSVNSNGTLYGVGMGEVKTFDRDGKLISAITEETGVNIFYG